MNQLSEDIVNKIIEFLVIEDVNSMRLVNSNYRKKWHVYDNVCVHNAEIFNIYVLYKIILKQRIDNINEILINNAQLIYLDCTSVHNVTNESIYYLINLTNLYYSSDDITDTCIESLPKLTCVYKYDFYQESDDNTPIWETDEYLRNEYEWYSSQCL